MRFYNRENEIKFFDEIWENSSNYAQLTIVVGRRRIGKTILLKKVIENIWENKRKLWNKKVIINYQLSIVN